MYFIVNKTTQTIIIADLKLTLGPRQGIDLDNLMDRSKADKSKGLSTLISKGSIDVKRKDEEEKRQIVVQETKENDIDVEKMKREIIDGVKQSISEVVSSAKQPNIDMEEMIKIISGIVKENKNNVVESKGEEHLVEDGVLADIHSRVVDKIMKKTDGKNIDYKKEKTENDLSDNISELEGLI